MLYLHSFTFNPFQENTYIIYNDEKECWIVDPGMSNSREEHIFVEFLESNSLVPQKIINTHAHIDHILGVQFVKDNYKIPFGIHEKELPILHNALASATMFGLPMHQPPTHDFLIDFDNHLLLGKDELVVRFVPGHSPGSIIFYYEKGNWAVTGDAIFYESIGRTDLPGGDFNTLDQSIRKEIYTLPGDTFLYPGHGPKTNVCHEKMHNPFVSEDNN